MQECSPLLSPLHFAFTIPNWTLPFHCKSYLYETQPHFAFATPVTTPLCSTLPLQNVTPLCLYNTKLNFTFPLQSISLQNTTPLCLCKTCPSVNSQYCTKPPQCITVLFHYVTLPYIVFVTPLCLHNASRHQTLPYHYISLHGHSIHRCSFTMRSLPFPTNPLLCYSVSLQCITFANHYFWKHNPTLPLQIITVTLYPHISIAIRFHSYACITLAQFSITPPQH